MKLVTTTLTALLISTQALAVSTMHCVITEGGEITRETNLSHEFTEIDHNITPFETAYTTGFISVSRGYGVVNLVMKEDQRVLTFHGDVIHGRGLGGGTVLPGGNSWLSIECN